MSCLYCGGSQREERNPNRCWGCGAAVPRERGIRPVAIYPVQPKGPRLQDQIWQVGGKTFVSSDLLGQMQQLQNAPGGGFHGYSGGPSALSNMLFFGGVR